MADHGVNRRKSHFARMRQRRGKEKMERHKKWVTERIKQWHLFWHGDGKRPKSPK